MDVLTFMPALAEALNGSFSEYDETTTITVVPLEDGRFQSIQGTLETLDDGLTQVMRFSSHVCPFHESLDFQHFLTENQQLRYAKFTVTDTFVQVEASVFIDFLSHQNMAYLKNMMTEIALVADAWEHKLTGLDVF